jgi:hypothetical protein
MGPEAAKKAFVYYPASSYPNQPNTLTDDTHFNAYGAYELAKCIVKSIVDQNLPLKKYISKNYKSFNLNKPDDVEKFHWPESVLWNL